MKLRDRTTQRDVGMVQKPCFTDPVVSVPCDLQGALWSKFHNLFLAPTVSARCKSGFYPWQQVSKGQYPVCIRKILTRCLYACK